LIDHAPNVASQFRDCGIEHLGPKLPAAGAHELQREALALDLEKARSNDMLQYIFIRVSVQGGVLIEPPSLTLADLEFAIGESGSTLFTVEVTSNSLLLREGGVLAVVLLQDEGFWFAIPLLLPCGDASLQESALLETLDSYARKASVSFVEGAPLPASAAL